MTPSADWRFGLRCTGGCLISGRPLEALLGLAEPADETVGRHLGNLTPAVGAALKVFADRLGRGVVELAQSICS